MKIHFISDLHLECSYGVYKHLEFLPEADVCILSGDVSTAISITKANTGYEKFFSTLNEKYKHTFYIPGNHEYYRKNYPDVEPVITEYLKKYQNITFGSKIYKEIDGVNFIGATLWTNFGNDPLTAWDAERCIADFKVISNFNKTNYFGKKFSTDDANKLYSEHLHFINEKLAIQNQNKKVVFTHFSPSLMMSHPKWGNEPLNKYFHNSISPDIIEMADIWICGHTHDPADKMFGNTRMLCNPNGYPGEQDKFLKDELKFNPELVIEV